MLKFKVFTDKGSWLIEADSVNDAFRKALVVLLATARIFCIWRATVSSVASNTTYAPKTATASIKWLSAEHSAPRLSF